MARLINYKKEDGETVTGFYERKCIRNKKRRFWTIFTLS